MSPRPAPSGEGAARARNGAEPASSLRRQGAATQLPTRHGDFALLLYQQPGGLEHIALTMGTVQDGLLVRLHSECFTGDVLLSVRCDCGAQLGRAMELIATEGHGAILYLRQEGRGIGLQKKLESYRLQDQGFDTVQANALLGFPPDLREYSSAAAILRDLGLSRVRLLTNNPDKIAGLEAHGIQVVERVPLIAGGHPANRSYLETKRVKLGHLLLDEY